MGWTPDAPSLGLAASQDLIAANGGSRFSKKISMIPTAKDDNMGIGARRGGGSAGGLGSLRAMGQPATGGMGMGFVTATSSHDGSDKREAPKSGGEFGRLLERLNKAKAEAAAASASTSTSGDATESVPVVEELDEKAKRKKEKREKKERKEAKKAEKDKKRKRSDDDVDGEDDTTSQETVAELQKPNAPAGASLTAAATQAILRNPRMA